MAKRPATKKKNKSSRIFDSYFQSHQRTKQALIKEVHAAGLGRGPNWPDGASDAAFHIIGESKSFVRNRGGFDRIAASIALSDWEWETKEHVAAWLRKELAQLRKYSGKPGEAPIRRGKALSRLQIAEIAIELLEPMGGSQLTSLFQELLDVDRHRKSLAANFESMTRGAQLDATSQLQGRPLGVNALARAISVAGSSVTRWRRSAAYLERVRFHREIWEKNLRDDYFPQIRSLNPTATDAECFRQAFQMYVEKLPQRQLENLKLIKKHSRSRGGVAGTQAVSKSRRQKRSRMGRL